MLLMRTSLPQAGKPKETPPHSLTAEHAKYAEAEKQKMRIPLSPFSAWSAYSAVEWIEKDRRSLRDGRLAGEIRSFHLLPPFQTLLREAPSLLGADTGSDSD